MPKQTTFVGPAIDDPELLYLLPKALAELLNEVNGFIQFRGAFHLRGACREPLWHSLRHAWEGPESFQNLYPEVQPEDIPFAEDCMGDQFLLRKGLVLRLSAETGEVTDTALAFSDFLDQVAAASVPLLQMQPLLRHERGGGALLPGQLLSAYPPFSTTEAAKGVSLKAVPADQARRFLAGWARDTRQLPSGAKIRVTIAGRPTTR